MKSYRSNEHQCCCKCENSTAQKATKPTPPTDAGGNPMPVEASIEEVKVILYIVVCLILGATFALATKFFGITI